MLIGCAPDVPAADAALAPLVTEALVLDCAAAVPDRWLLDEPGFAGPDELRAAYVAQLTARVAARPAWLPGLLAAAAAGELGRTERRAAAPRWLGGVTP